MRVTSPPKHSSQVNRYSSPVKTAVNYNTYHSPLQQTSFVYHHLKSPSQRPVTSHVPSTAQVKQNLYAELRHREQEYVQLIKDLNKENQILKAELGKMSHFDQPQLKRQSVTTILSLSPGKIDMSKTFGSSMGSYNQKAFRNVQNQKQMNSTFSGFGFSHNEKQNQPIQNNIIRQNLSPFSKKPVIMSNTSPAGFGNTKGSIVVSPGKRILRPVSNVVQVSNPFVVIHSSPVKNVINHSYQPSLISYQYPSKVPSQNQSMEGSPKKSFESIQGLNSEVFSQSNGSNMHESSVHPDESKIRGQVPNSNFFDMKKRQLNYGSIFAKQKNAQSSKSINTTLKMSTKNFIEKQQKPTMNLKISEKQDYEAHLNPSNTKRHKVNKTQKSEFNETELQTQHVRITEFNLQENIDKNPLLNMLKKRLQEEADFLVNNQDSNNDVKQGESLDPIPYCQQQSQYNPNIRYSVEHSRNASQVEPPTNIVHPLKRNIFQAFPILSQLRTTQQHPHELQARNVQSQQASQIQITKESLQGEEQVSESNISSRNKISQSSQLMIEEVQSCQKTMTIVRMLEENRRRQLEEEEEDDEEREEEGEEQEEQEEQEGENQSDETQCISTQVQQQLSQMNDLVAMHRESFEQGEDCHQEIQGEQCNQVDGNDQVEFECEHQPQEQDQQQEQYQQENQQQQQAYQNLQITNRYYCQKTQQDQSRVAARLHNTISPQKTQSQQQQQQQSPKLSQRSISKKKTIKKVSINENQQVFEENLSSDKILACLQVDESEDEVSRPELMQKKVSQIVMEKRQSGFRYHQDHYKHEVEQQLYPKNTRHESSRQRLSDSTQYKLFYVNKKDNNNCSEISDKSPCQYNGTQDVKGTNRYQDSRLSDAWSDNNSLRSQKFKKISNRAYL